MTRRPLRYVVVDKLFNWFGNALMWLYELVMGKSNR